MLPVRFLYRYQKIASKIMRPPNIPPTMAPVVVDVRLPRAPDVDVVLEVGVDADMDVDGGDGDRGSVHRVRPAESL